MHIPVLQKEVIEFLDIKPNENFIDCTAGCGGHILAILEEMKSKSLSAAHLSEKQGRVLGIDWDKSQIQKLPKNKRLVLVQNNFSNLANIVKEKKFPAASGILFDLGFSSWHLEGSSRGFTFLKDEPLDMRYDLNNPLTAEKIINYNSEIEIEKILKEFGEEQFSKQIAKAIIRERRVKPIKTTFQLVNIVNNAVPGFYKRKKISPATKTFQALRIAVNGEIDNLKNVLPQAESLLKKNGRLLVISFHSLEDRIVKNYFKESGLKILTKKPIIPKSEEVKYNPRARSAKLRVAVKA